MNEKRAVIEAGRFSTAGENERKTAFMAGHSVISRSEERKAVTISTPKIPRRETVKPHQLPQIPDVPWSQDCVPGRDHQGPCFCQDGCEKVVVTPVVPLDDISLGLSDEASEEDTTSMLALCDGSTTQSLDLMIPRKRPEPCALRDVCVSLQELSYIRMTLKSDGESSITVREAVQKEWAGDSKNFRRQSFPQERLENAHASTGVLEAKESGAREGKAPTGSAWDFGIWLSRSTRINEHLVCTRIGVIRAGRRTSRCYEFCALVG